MGFVSDQSPYYPFITSGAGPPRQARIAVWKSNLNLRASTLVWCCFNWTRCESQKSTMMSLHQKKWPNWAKCFFCKQNGVSLLKTGSPCSPGQSLTWLMLVYLASTMWCSAAPLLFQKLQNSQTFLAAKRQQLHIFAEMRPWSKAWLPTEQSWW